jgi:hypothetical protein
MYTKSPEIIYPGAKKPLENLPYRNLHRWVKIVICTVFPVVFSVLMKNCPAIKKVNYDNITSFSH